MEVDFGFFRGAAQDMPTNALQVSILFIIITIITIKMIMAGHNWYHVRAQVIHDYLPTPPAQAGLGAGVHFVTKVGSIEIKSTPPGVDEEPQP